MTNPIHEAMHFDKKDNQWKSMVGSKFGRLLVIEYLGKKEREKAPPVGRYRCTCDCGNEVERNHSCLTQRQTVSCGCWSGEKISLRCRKEDTAFKDLWHSYRKGARERELQWELTLEQFRILTSSPCFYTGRIPAQEARSSALNKRIKQGKDDLDRRWVYLYNGIDRLNSSKGYTIDNCVPCCKDVNTMKMALGKEDFIALCKEVVSYRPW